MTLSRTGDKGFTLVELLIVLAILAVLSAVVLFNVSNTFRRGAEQAYYTDQKTIQQVTALFYFDPHAGPGSAWGGEVEGHYYPTADGQAAANDLDELLAAAGSNPDYFDDGANGAIWMGLLANSPADGTIGNDFPDSAHPQRGEGGPYLNAVVKSASINNGNMFRSGTYTWVICRDGKVYGLYWDGSEWKEGCSGTYP